MSSSETNRHQLAGWSGLIGKGPERDGARLNLDILVGGPGGSAVCRTLRPAATAGAMRGPEGAERRTGESGLFGGARAREADGLDRRTRTRNTFDPLSGLPERWHTRAAAARGPARTLCRVLPQGHESERHPYGLGAARTDGHDGRERRR